MKRAWGQAKWGLFPWGQAELDAEKLSAQIVYRSPGVGAIDVDEGQVIEVRFGHPAGLLDERAIRLYLDGALIYDGVTGFVAGVVGRVQSVSGVVSVQFYAPEGLTFGSRPVLRVVAGNGEEPPLDETWTFSVRDNPAWYSGYQALPVETTLQQPYDLFLALEPVRQLVLGSVLRQGLMHINNHGNKAARAVYQLAFATELSTLQNPFYLKSKRALDVTVYEKENTLLLDQKLLANREHLVDGIQGFKRVGVFSDAYVQSFHEYLNSNLYLYRASLVCNLILYAAAYEHRQRG